MSIQSCSSHCDLLITQQLKQTVDLELPNLRELHRPLMHSGVKSLEDGKLGRRKVN